MKPKLKKTHSIGMPILSVSNRLRAFAYRSFMIGPYFICLCLLWSFSEFRDFIFVNVICQVVIFAFAANLPALLTKRMSFVDIAWPWGLFTLGVVGLTTFENESTLFRILCGCYIFTGGRMGIGALMLYREGHLDSELPRYQFQRKRWEKIGAKNETLSLQYEISVQGFANMSFLSIPLLLLGHNTNLHWSIFEVLGFSLWTVSFALEHLADWQKLKFNLKNKKERKPRQNCEVGLWKYSRHPNYFFEWMIWNSYILISIPSLLFFAQNYSTIETLLLGTALGALTFIFYYVLVFYTGAIPAEYYSLKKRPEYADYQRRVSRFFPGVSSS